MATIKTASPKKEKNRIAIFIDAANFEISLKQCGLYADYDKLLKWASEDGKIVLLRYYSPTFGTTGQNKFFSYIKNKGFKLITKSIKTIKKRQKQTLNKANFDVEIAFDAAVNIKSFNKVILFSGDSDFVYLVSQLQKRGTYITVASVQWRTARELKKQADKFIDLRNCDFAKKKAPLRERSQQSFDCRIIIPKGASNVKY